MYYISLAVRRFLITALLVAPIAQSKDVCAQPMDLSKVRGQGTATATTGNALPGAKPIVASDQGNAPANVRRPRGRKPRTARPAGKPLALSGAQHSRNGAQAKRKQKPSGRGAKSNSPGASPAIGRDRRIVGFGLQQLPGEPDTPPQLAAQTGTPAVAKTAGTKREGVPPSAAVAAARPVAEAAPKPAKCDVNESTKARVEALVTRFCTNNAASLERARLAWQKNELESLGQKVKDASVELGKKLEELKSVRDEIAKLRKQQNEKVVTIFSEMRPDAAAQQLNSMKQDDAVGILTAMQPKVASLILNEMPPKQAALLSGSMLANKNGGTPSGTPAQK